MIVIMTATDPRVLRTRARLFEAALTLAAAGDTARLSMAEVAKAAGVNRATAYLHFDNLDDLLAEAMDDTIRMVAATTALCPLDAPADQPPQPLIEVFTHIGERVGLYRAMLCADGNARFAARLRTRMCDAFTERFAAGVRPVGSAGVPACLLAAYLTGAFIGVVAHWVSSKDPESPAEVAAATWSMVAGQNSVA